MNNVRQGWVGLASWGSDMCVSVLYNFSHLVFCRQCLNTNVLNKIHYPIFISWKLELLCLSYLFFTLDVLV